MNRIPRAVLISGLALIVAVGLANGCLLFSREDDLRAELAAAVGTSLGLDARLSGGFAPSEYSRKRSSESSAGDLAPDTRIAIARVEKRAASNPSPGALADFGVALLIDGKIDRAISTLRDVASQSRRASTWSDLAAAYVAKADSVPARRLEYLARALEAATESLRLGPTDDARFNRALILHRLAPFVGDHSDPWADYVAHERNPLWLESARRQQGNRRPAADARDRWEARRTELERHLAALDRTFVVQTVQLFPEASFESFGRLLLHWANARLAGDRSSAARDATHAQLLADAIQEVIGDRQPIEEAGLLGNGGIVLAQAHVDYAEGMRQYGADDYDAAKKSFDRARAGFAEAHSSFVATVDAQLATILFQQRDLTAADRQLATVESVTRARRYETLLGRTLWVRGLIFAKGWQLTKALETFRAAASCFERAGQREYALGIYSLLADTLRSLGETNESWINIGKTLEQLPVLRSPTRRYVALYNAALFASRHDLMEAAFVFQNAAVREAETGGRDNDYVDAITQRAVIHLRRNDRVAAAGDLQAAVDRVEKIPDGAPKQFLRAEIDVLEAQLGQTAGEAWAPDRLRRAIAFFQKAEPARLPDLFLKLARMHLANRSLSAAEETLDDGIAVLERQQESLGDEALKISYFDESWDLFQELIEVQLREYRNVDKAFAYAERSRARLLASSATLHQAPLRSIGDVQKQLPASVTLVYYVTLPERLLIWALTASSSRFVEHQIASADLARLTDDYRHALIDQRPGASDGPRLYDFLIAPIADLFARDGTIVFAADGTLQQLPFATLRNPKTQRYLVEDYAIAMTPSATVFVAGRARARELTTGLPASALLVGNPAGAGPAALRSAELEVAEAAKFYPAHEVLTGPAATKARFVGAAPRFDVVHFGGHGYVNVEYPLLSRLEFAANGVGSDNSLFAHEISALSFSRTRVVVLAACSTAGGAIVRGEGVVSVARPFLGAGVPFVIASQWDVDDSSTSRLLREFHRTLATRLDPVAALRAAQLTLLRGQDPALRTPAAWGPFVALGTTAQ